MSLRSVKSRAGFEVPLLGQGTWGMGERGAERAGEVAALALGLDLGMTLIDTAEMYANGEAERVVAEACRGRRDEAFLVSKVLPQNASRTGTLVAAERSLRNLETDRIDLYLLHWPGHHPLEDTLAAFAQLVEEGKILYYGVSNFDAEELAASETLKRGEHIAANQVLYNLGRRGIEARVLPWCEQRGVLVMAYSPFDHGRLRRRSPLDEVARRHGCTPYQVALAWAVRLPGVMAIPKASRAEHVRENAAAAALRLTPPDLVELDAAFPPPPADAPLEVL